MSAFSAHLAYIERGLEMSSVSVLPSKAVVATRMHQQTQRVPHEEQASDVERLVSQVLFSNNLCSWITELALCSWPAIATLVHHLIQRNFGT